MKRLLSLKILVVLFLSATIVCAQNVPKVTITGRVVDDSTLAPLENVNVYLAHTTRGSSTDKNGRFQIPNVYVGPYEIVASRVGYSFAVIRTTISELAKKEFEIRLKPSAIQVEGVVVTAPDAGAWREQLKKFVDLFLGKSANASACKILNPEVLDFKIGENTTFDATARAPLEFDNHSLGYHLRFFLVQFRVASARLTVEGFPVYSELKPTGSDDMQVWKQNRQKTYKGSLRHFLSSLFRREANKDGFVLYLEPWVTGAAWDPFRIGIVEDTILFETTWPSERVLRFTGILEVEYTRARLDPNYDFLKKEGSDNQISWLMLNHEAVSIDSRGLIKDWFPTLTYGYWGWQRMADALPQDYETEQE